MSGSGSAARRWSVTTEGGEALVLGGADAFLEVVGGQGDRLGHRLPLQRGLEVAVAAVEEGELGEPAGDGGSGGDAVGDLEDLGQERRGVQDPGDQPDAERLVGVDDPAGEQEVARVRLARVVPLLGASGLVFGSWYALGALSLAPYYF